MKTPREWRSELIRVAMLDEAMPADEFILRVQREAFDAGARAMMLAVEWLSEDRLSEAEIAKAVDLTKLPGRP